MGCHITYAYSTKFRTGELASQAVSLAIITRNGKIIAKAMPQNNINQIVIQFK